MCLSSIELLRDYFFHNACKRVLSNTVHAIYIYILNVFIHWVGYLNVPRTAYVGTHIVVLSCRRPFLQTSATGSLQNHYFQCPRQSSQLCYFHLSFTFPGIQLAWGWKACIKIFSAKIILSQVVTGEGNLLQRPNQATNLRKASEFSTSSPALIPPQLPTRAKLTIFK